MIKCCACSKTIKVKGKYVRTCKTCKEAICPNCNVNGYCRSCHPANADLALIQEYRDEKYKEKEMMRS